MPSKVAHNWPQAFFSQVWPGCPNQPRIDFSYHKMSGTSIYSLFCDHGCEYAVGVNGIQYYETGGIQPCGFPDNSQIVL